MNTNNRRVYWVIGIAICLAVAVAVIVGERHKPDHSMGPPVGEVNLTNGKLTASPANAYTSMLGHPPGGVAASVAGAQQIVIAVNKNDPPRSMVGKSGVPRGFDVAVARTAAKILGLNVQWVTTTPADVTSGLASGRYDVAVESIAVPATPTDGLLFSNPYAYRPVQIFTSVGGPQIAGAKDLDGRKVGALAGSPAAVYLNQATKAKVRLFKTADKAYPQLLNGNLEFLALDSGIAVKLINRGVPISMSGKPVAYQDLAFAVKAGETDLVTLLNYAIGKMHERVNGQPSALSTLSMKWFNGVDLTVKAQ